MLSPTFGTSNEFDENPLAPSRGVIIGVVIVAVFWAVIGSVLYFAFFG
jgi:hypothetical protein